ncbi:MAG: carboxypeptidase-like regulatory domain-containing protein [Bacteroidales bacterium]|nr:carboxypeptidase-like regulatory domain-containing protein [Bacteroidales bacterium]
MKTYLLILSALILNISIAKATGELTQTIRGTVVDAISGYPIIGAYVILLNAEPKVGVTTDVNGIFELRKVPLGRQSLQINCIGYEPEIYNNLMLVSGKEVILEVKLSEKVNNLGEVVIKLRQKSRIPE